MAEESGATVRAAVDAFLSSPRCANRNTRRAYAGALDRLAGRLGVERLLTRRDIPLRERTLWRMLYETTARASEILALDIDDLDLAARRARVRSKGCAVEYVYWASGTAHLLPRLLAGRTRGPMFLSHRRPGPARRPAAKDLCPDTGRARLGYDRARTLLDRCTSPGEGRPGWDMHQFRHSAATYLGEQKVGLGLLMAKTRHRNPRTALRYVQPGADAVAEVTELLDTALRRSG